MLTKKRPFNNNNQKTRLNPKTIQLKNMNRLFLIKIKTFTLHKYQMISKIQNKLLKGRKKLLKNKNP
jgi:hypothetical protein